MAVPQIRQYSKKASEYAELYSISLSVAQRWMKLNAPLDDGSRMFAWVHANSQKPPASFRVDAYEANENDETESDEQEEGIEGLELGARAEITALIEECAKARVRYQQAKSDVLKEARWKQWQLMLDQMRKLQKDTPRSEKDDGKTVQIADVQESLTRALVGIRKEMESIPQGISMAISHFPPATIIEVEQAAKAAVDDVIASMQKGRWIECASE